VQQGLHGVSRTECKLLTWVGSSEGRAGNDTSHLRSGIFYDPVATN
jgi:hypothetical protein